MSTVRIVRYASALLACSAVWNAQAQPCEPHWDGTIGAVGIEDGYVGAIGPWSDTTGEYLIVGGSFGGIIGVGGTSLIAAWSPATQTWSSVGGGLSTGFTNGFLTSVTTFNDELIVGGFFHDAAGVDGTKSLAKWNGSAWSALGSQFDPASASSVWTLLSWNDQLIVGGSFPTAGGVTAGGIAAWNGSMWSSLGSGTGGSFSPVVFRVAAYDDGNGEDLYAVGRFDSMDGVSARMMARYDGEQWSQVGGGLTPSSVVFGLEAATVFDDGSGPALYVGGAPFTPAGQPQSSVAKWDGTSWTKVGQVLGGRVTSLQVFDDGSGQALYVGGTAQPAINYMARLEGGTWVTLDGGVSGADFPSVFSLGVFDGDLYVGGSFDHAGGIPANGIAAWVGCAGGTECPGDVNGDNVVDLSDLATLLSNFGITGGATREQGDLSGDGNIDLTDLATLLANFGGTC